MDFRIEYFEKFDDKRGQLVVFLRRRDVPIKLRKFGQIYFVTFKKRGVVRGNHYHKRLREWFGVVEGKLEVHLKDIRTNEVKRIVLNSDNKKYLRLEIGPNVAHAFKNLSSTASLLNYTDKEWSPDDVFRCEIVK